MHDPVPEHVDGYVDILERSELHGLIADIMLQLLHNAERSRRKGLSKR